MADIPYVFRTATFIDRQAPHPVVPATPGGQGSFSYLDTKVYGPRQLPQMYNRIRFKWDYSEFTYDPISGYRVNGGVTENVPISPPKGLIIPGTGGSAKAPGRRYFGSRAIGFNPNGLVLIRLIKV